MDKLWLRIAYLLPKSLIYWASIRLMANAIQGKYSDQIVLELTIFDALDRWS